MKGRISKYLPQFIEQVDIYLKSTGRQMKRLPTIESFALFVGVHKDTLYEWKKKYPEFSDAMSRILLMQEVQLIDDGIYGGKEVNVTIIKLMLQNNHGMKERKDTTTNNKGIPTPIYSSRSINK